MYTVLSLPSLLQPLPFHHVTRAKEFHMFLTVYPVHQKPEDEKISYDDTVRRDWRKSFLSDPLSLPTLLEHPGATP